MCNCIQLFNESNREKNITLVTTIPWHQGEPSYILLAVDKIDRKQRTKIPHIIGAYCPFCGQEIKPKEAEK